MSSVGNNQSSPSQGATTATVKNVSKWKVAEEKKLTAEADVRAATTGPISGSSPSSVGS
jgi:hypothetical protein